MNKKLYIKPEMEVLSGDGMSLLAGSQLGSDVVVSRQQDATFTDDVEEDF